MSTSDDIDKAKLGDNASTSFIDRASRLVARSLSDESITPSDNL